MFNNVDAELKRQGMTRGNLAKMLNISPSTLSFKLNGKAPITLREGRLIKSLVKSDLPLEELFKEFD